MSDGVLLRSQLGIQGGISTKEKEVLTRVKAAGPAPAVGPAPTDKGHTDSAGEWWPGPNPNAKGKITPPAAPPGMFMQGGEAWPGQKNKPGDKGPAPPGMFMQGGEAWPNPKPVMAQVVPTVKAAPAIVKAAPAAGGGAEAAAAAGGGAEAASGASALGAALGPAAIAAGVLAIGFGKLISEVGNLVGGVKDWTAALSPVSQEIFNQGLRDLQATLGTAVLPAFDSMASVFRKAGDIGSGCRSADSCLDSTQRHGYLSTGEASTVLRAVVDVFKQLMPTVESLFSSFKELGGQAIGLALSSFKALLLHLRRGCCLALLLLAQAPRRPYCRLQILGSCGGDGTTFAFSSTIQAGPGAIQDSRRPAHRRGRRPDDLR